MPTNLAIDDQLLEQARRIGKHKTKKETVNTALEEYISSAEAAGDPNAVRHHRL